MGRSKAKVEGSIRKTCDLCNFRKKKCDGRGSKCSLCIKGGLECVYSRRRPQKPRQRTNTGGGVIAINGASSRLIPSEALVTTLVGGSAREPRLKRCRLSASPATGLVGMQENEFLNDFFGCMGFLPLTCQRTVRETMVKLFWQAANPTSTFDIEGNERRVTGALAPTSGGMPWEVVDPSTSMFWCAVALGGLTAGRTGKDVAKYIKRAQSALEGVPVAAMTSDVARAWSLMAYLYGFCGDTDKYQMCQRRAETLLQLSAEGELVNQADFVGLVRHAKGVRMFYGQSASEEDVKSYIEQVAPHPQVEGAVTEGNMCVFVMDSYRRFGQAFLRDAYAEDARVEARERSVDVVSPASDEADCDGVVELEYGRSEERAGVVVMVGEEAMAPPSRGGNMLEMMKQAMPEYERLEHAVDMPTVRRGIGGLMINSTLVMLKACTKDIPGAIERISRCVEVLVRYPGMCRFPMGLHLAHLLFAALVALDHQELYDKLRRAYNPMTPMGSAPFPPFEEWEGIEPCCSHVYCRSIEPKIRLYSSGVVSAPESHGFHTHADSPATEHFEGCDDADLSEFQALPFTAAGCTIGPSLVDDQDQVGNVPHAIVSSGDEDDVIAASATASEDLDPIVTPTSYGIPAIPSTIQYSAYGLGKDPSPMLAQSKRGMTPYCEELGKSIAPASGDFLRDKCGDIDGGNMIKSAPEVAEAYLLSGSDEEEYLEAEDALAAGSWLDETEAIGRQQMYLHRGAMG